MPIVPLPSSLQMRSGRFRLDERTLVSFQHEDDAPTAKLLRRAIGRQTGVPVKIGRRARPRGILLARATGLPREAYRLTVREIGVTIEASDAAGMFYGTQTLLQLLEGPELPGCDIEDVPSFPWRGLMLDAARHFQRVETVKRVLDQMALLKLNVLHWHLVDDSGWRLQIERYPLLTEWTQKRLRDEPGGRGFYTRNQVREIVAYALDRQIRIVPEIEIPAHTTVAMAAYPHLTCTGERAPATGVGIHRFTHSTGKRIYCASNPECLEFVSNVLDEVCELFPSPVIHVGGDERPEGIWSACPRCSNLMEREGLSSETALQRWFMGKVAEIVRRKGRRSMAWTPTVEFGVPEGEIVQDWHFGVTREALALGADVVNSRDRYTYFDYPNFPGRQKPTWMPVLPIERVYEFQPDHDGPVLGAECSLWTEMVAEEDLSEALFPRVLAFAETVWTPRDRRDLPGFLERVQRIRPLLEGLGATYASPAEGPRAAGASVRTTMHAQPPFHAECAFDGRFTRYFWSKDPPKAGDSFTIFLDEKRPVRAIRVYTGCDIAKDDVLDDGWIEVSEDGTTFERVAPIDGGIAEAKFSARSLKAVRIAVAADMAHRLAVTEVVLVPSILKP
ncbi:MAG TPA: beta-N-acetylhexosaminidase [Fimbriimonas sp.]